MKTLLLAVLKVLLRAVVFFSLGAGTVYLLLFLSDAWLGDGNHGVGAVFQLIFLVSLISTPLGFGIYKAMPKKFQVLP